MLSLAVRHEFCLLSMCFCLLGGPALQGQDRKITLREQYQSGEQYQVTTTTELSGDFFLPGDTARKVLPRTLRKSGNARSSYDERILAVDANQQPVKTVRRYLTLHALQKIGEDMTTAQLRGAIKHVILQRDGQANVTFSPDGPMLLGEIEQVRTDIFIPRLAALLPGQAVAVGQGWKADPSGVQELTDLQQIQTGELNCTLQKIEQQGGRDTAVVQFMGDISGAGPQGPNRQTMQGTYHFDLQANRLVSLRFEVTSRTMDKDGKESGNATASYQLVRNLASDAAVNTAGLALEPTEDNTLILVQEPRLALDMLHSRRWVPRPMSDKQWAIDGPSGSGLTVQFETAANVPEADKIRKDIETALGRTAQGLRAESDPAGWSDGYTRAQRLAWRGTQNGKEFVFEYFLWKQGPKGAIVAARYFAPEATQAQKDAERMIRSLKLMP
jgi:hypothetical protein